MAKPHQSCAKLLEHWGCARGGQREAYSGVGVVLAELDTDQVGAASKLRVPGARVGVVQGCSGSPAQCQIAVGGGSKA